LLAKPRGFLRCNTTFWCRTATVFFWGPTHETPHPRCLEDSWPDKVVFFPRGRVPIFARGKKHCVPTARNAGSSVWPEGGGGDKPGNRRGNVSVWAAPGPLFVLAGLGVCGDFRGGEVTAPRGFSGVFPSRESFPGLGPRVFVEPGRFGGAGSRGALGPARGGPERKGPPRSDQARGATQAAPATTRRGLRAPDGGRWPLGGGLPSRKARGGKLGHLAVFSKWGGRAGTSAGAAEGGIGWMMGGGQPRQNPRAPFGAGGAVPPGGGGPKGFAGLGGGWGPPFRADFDAFRELPAVRGRGGELRPAPT